MAENTSRERKRRKAIEELLSTEKTYVHLMSKLVDDYVVYLRSHGSILPAEDYQVLFPADIHAILGLNQTFLKELTKIIESKSFNIKNTKIGDVIYDFCPHFKMYQNYLNNYQYAVTRLAQLRQNKTSAFSIYCDAQRNKKYFNNLPIESLIILPIQRMPRYKMLLEEIIKHTEKQHPDLNQLQNALAKISEVNNVINTRMKEFDQRIEVQNIENRFNGKITNLVTPSRKYIKQGELCKIETKDDQYYIFILFSDCILYASRGMMGDSLIFGNLLHFNSKFVIKQTSDTVNINKMEHLFEMHSTSESFMVYADSKEIMDDWIQCITSAYNHHMSFPTSVNKNESKLYPKTLFIPNDFTDRCMLKGCSTKFSVVNRRHHCRYCGLVVCSACSTKQLRSRRTRINDVPRLVRVCDNCHQAYRPSLPKQASASSIWKASKRIHHRGTIQVPMRQNQEEKERSLETFARAQQEELIQLFEKRAQKVDEDDRRRMSEQSMKNKRSVSNMDNLDLPIPSPIKRRTAVLTFVKQDVEPKLLQLETEKMSFEEKVHDLETENSSLRKRVCVLEIELKKKDELIKQLLAKHATPSSPGIYQVVSSAPPPPPRNGNRNNVVGLANSVTRVLAETDAFTSSEDEDEDKKPPKMCAQCNKKIVGRAIMSKDGLFHKACLVCNECKNPLPGKNYTIVFGSDGKNLKLCEKCRNDEQFQFSLDRRDTYCAASVLD